MHSTCYYATWGRMGLARFLRLNRLEPAITNGIASGDSQKGADMTGLCDGIDLRHPPCSCWQSRPACHPRGREPGLSANVDALRPGGFSAPGSSAPVQLANGPRALEDSPEG